jgi:phage terminase small subunit
MKLTPEEERFVDEYLIDFNGTAAYCRVHPGAKRRTASVEASRLVAKPNIAKAIRRGRRDLARRCGLSAERVLRELAKIAFFDPGAVCDLTSDRLQLLPPRQIPPEARATVAGVKVRRRVTQPRGVRVVVEEVEFMFCDKLRALALLMRHLGLLRDLPPLEVLLGALPPELATAVRERFAELLKPVGRVPSITDNASRRH